ncbi:MAG: DUF3291 domain-containing protein [Bacteroidota bacterium]
MMQFAHGPMQKIPGLKFYKLMGTGKEKFNPFPDWSVYGILQIWNNEQAANDYFISNPLFLRYRGHSEKNWILYLKNKVARGEWNGTNPFHRSQTLREGISLVAVLTRATIKTKLLFKFWKYVPKSQTNLWGNEGLIFAKGIGEVPFRQMATFSLWKDEKSLHEFAYQTKGHVSAIGKTRKLNWYNEELFARFQPYKSFGNWEIDAPLLNMIKKEKA